MAKHEVKSEELLKMLGEDFLHDLESIKVYYEKAKKLEWKRLKSYISLLRVNQRIKVILEHQPEGE
ncbi:hypothetical protein [Pyrococcus abyssi]|uniref:hypothetical protein n=1 Tax=Pyrococcus abyssi TaxID=29292 RepID=UPI00064FC8F2|nr:hypothetical protein [Pyrococcus abyssi]